MSRNDNQRRGNQLVRYFDDVSLLSPVPEELSDSPPPPPPPAPLSPTGSCSPLPPLIIEVEKRVNKHDHPEEFYERLEIRMKKLYKRLFIEGRNVSSPMSTDDDDEFSNDDNRSKESSNSHIDIDEGTDDGGEPVVTSDGNIEPVITSDGNIEPVVTSDGNIEPVVTSDGNIEPVVTSDGSLKRKSNDSSESDEEEVRPKKSKRNHSSSSDDKPRSLSKEDLITISSEAEKDSIETENAEETNHADKDIDSYIEDIDESYAGRDDVESTSESFDGIPVTFQADVHRADETDDMVPPADVDDEMDGDGDDVEGDEDSEAADEEIEELLENTEGRNVSSPMSTDDDYEFSNDDNRSEESSNSHIDIDEGTDDGGEPVVTSDGNIEPVVTSDGNIEPVVTSDGNIEPVVTSDGSLKRKSNDSSESDEEEVRPKKSKRNHSSSSDDKPRSLSKEDLITISSEAEKDSIETENAEETNHADKDIDSYIEDIDESYAGRDDVESTSESFDGIPVTFQADVHRADETDDMVPPADVDDEMDGDGDDVEGDEDSEAADEGIEELLENNKVLGNNSSPAPDRGVDITTARVVPEDIHDAEPAGERTPEPLEKHQVVQNKLLAPARDRQVDPMRTPLVRSSVGSLAEHIDSIEEEALNGTQENADHDADNYEEVEVCDAETQTSPDFDWRNIFIGQPRVYRLCHY